MQRQPLEPLLERLERADLRRRRRTVECLAAPGSRAELIVAGRRLVDFSSSDYLGLAAHPEPAAAMAECAARCGAGTGASHLISGHGAEHAALEEELAAFTGREAMSDEMQALCFMAGANSIFYGEKLLTTGNPDVERDRRLFERLGLRAEAVPTDERAPRRAAAHPCHAETTA